MALVRLREATLGAEGFAASRAEVVLLHVVVQLAAGPRLHHRVLEPLLPRIVPLPVLHLGHLAALRALDIGLTLAFFPLRRQLVEAALAGVGRIKGALEHLALDYLLADEAFELLKQPIVQIRLRQLGHLLHLPDFSVSSFDFLEIAPFILL